MHTKRTRSIEDLLLPLEQARMPTRLLRSWIIPKGMTMAQFLSIPSTRYICNVGSKTKHDIDRNLEKNFGWWRGCLSEYHADLVRLSVDEQRVFLNDRAKILCQKRIIDYDSDLEIKNGFPDITVRIIRM